MYNLIKHFVQTNKISCSEDLHKLDVAIRHNLLTALIEDVGYYEELPLDPSAVLDIKIGDNDSEGETIREYLIALLEKIWGEGEGFSGKRPFGNSGWEYELTNPLMEQYGLTKSQANTMIFEAIAKLGEKE